MRLAHTHFFFIILMDNISAFQANLNQIREEHRLKFNALQTQAAKTSESSTTNKRPYTSISSLADEIIDIKKPPPQVNSGSDSDSSIECLGVFPSTSTSTSTSTSMSTSTSKSTSTVTATATIPPKTLTVMTWNVWFDETHVAERMKSIAAITAKHSVDVLLLQELTDSLLQTLGPELKNRGYTLHLQQQRGSYFVGIAIRATTDITITTIGTKTFDDSNQGRGLLFAVLKLPSNMGNSEIMVSTSHLESYVKEMADKNSAIRANQLQLVERFCKAFVANKPSITSVIFGGDCNWDDYKIKSSKRTLSDRKMSEVLTEWSDAWLNSSRDEHKEPGYTYDPKTNPMLGLKGSLRRRFDRILFDKKSLMQPFKVEVVGMPIITDCFRQKFNPFTHKYSDEKFPVVASDHFPFLTIFQTTPT